MYSISPNDSAQKRENVMVNSNSSMTEKVIEGTFFENPDAQELWSVSKLAKRLTVSRKTIYGWVYRGLIKPERIGPRLIRFTQETVERWLQTERK